MLGWCCSSRTQQQAKQQHCIFCLCCPSQRWQPCHTVAAPAASFARMQHHADALACCPTSGCCLGRSSKLLCGAALLGATVTEFYCILTGMVEGYLRHPSRALVEVPTGWPLSTCQQVYQAKTAGWNAPGLVCPAKEGDNRTGPGLSLHRPPGLAKTEPFYFN